MLTDLGAHLTPTYKAVCLSAFLDPRVEIDADLARVAGMDGNAARILQAARLLDQPDRLARFIRSGDREEADRLMAMFR